MFRLRTLGVVDLRTTDGEEVRAVLAQPKRVALLAYLALATPRGWQRRDPMMALFWPERDAEHARNALNQAVFFLRRHLGADTIVARNAEEIRLNQGLLWCDAVAFEAALDAGNAEGALDVYGGPFLEGFHVSAAAAELERWVDGERDRMGREYARALQQMADEREAAHDRAGAIVWYRRLTAHDPLSSRAALGLIRTLAAAGERASAIQHARTHQTLLREELQAPPDREVTAFVSELQAFGGAPPFTGKGGITATRRAVVSVPTAPLIGRAQELAAIAALLDTHRLVSLVGPGGVGKTRLAVQIAADRCTSYRDGSLVVSLAAVTSPEILVSTLAESLGIAFSGTRHPTLQLCDALRDKELLLVLDGLEHVMTATTVVTELAQRAVQLRVLVTSRERLNVADEVVLEIRGLAHGTSDAATSDDEPSVQLFLDRAKRADATFSAAPGDLRPIRHIAALLGGLPLGIELAASLTRILECEEIANELQRDLGTLSTSRRDLPERHRSLRAVFEQSWSTLRDPERSALMRLSILRGPFRRDVGLHVSGADLATVTALLDKSLLHRTNSGRFELHEIIRQFAEARLRERPELRVSGEDARAEYLAQFLQRRRPDLFGPRLYDVLEEIGDDLENIRAGWRHAIERGRDDLTLAYLPALQRFFCIRGRYAEGQAELAWAERRPQSDGLAALILARRAYLAHEIAAPSSRDLSRRSIQMLQQEGPSSTEMGVALQVQACIASDLGKHKAAERLYARALRILREPAATQELGNCLANWGITQIRLGRYEEGEQTLREAADIFTELGEPRGRAVALINLGTLMAEQDRRAEALELRVQSLAIVRSLRDVHLIGAALINLAESTILLERFAEARAILHEAREHFWSAGKPHGVCMCDMYLGEIERSSGTLEDAEVQFHQALRQARSLNAMPLVMRMLMAFARLRAAQERPADAWRLATTVLAHPATAEYDRRQARELRQSLVARIDEASRRGPDEPWRAEDTAAVIAQLV